MPALVGFPLDEAERFSGETLFLRGGASDYLRDEHRPVIARHFPHSRVETIEDAGHWLHAEDPARFIELTRAFLGCGAGNAP